MTLPTCRPDLSPWCGPVLRTVGRPAAPLGIEDHPPTSYATPTCARTLPSVLSGAESPPVETATLRAAPGLPVSCVHHRKLYGGGHTARGHPLPGRLFRGDLEAEHVRAFALRPGLRADAEIFRSLPRDLGGWLPDPVAHVTPLRLRAGRR